MQQVVYQSYEGLVEQKEEKNVNQKPGSSNHEVVEA